MAKKRVEIFLPADEGNSSGNNSSFLFVGDKLFKIDDDELIISCWIGVWPVVISLSLSSL